jgi:hypothetical protein
MCCVELQYYHFTRTEWSPRSTVHIFGDILVAFGELASDSFIGTFSVVKLRDARKYALMDAALDIRAAVNDVTVDIQTTIKDVPVDIRTDISDATVDICVNTIST